MAKSVVIDELIVIVRIPAGITDERAEAPRRVLLSDAFLTRIRRAVRNAVGSFPELRLTRVAVSR